MKLQHAMTFAAAAAITALSTVAGCATTQFSGLFVEQRSPDELRALLEPDFKIYKPDGAGPFPLVIAMHGCARLHANTEDYAARANAAGAAFLAVDSLGPRGIGYTEAVARICSGQTFWGRERAGDVLIALDYARDQSDLDTDNIALLGWSHGAWAIMDLLSMDLEQRMPTSLSEIPRDGVSGVKAAMLYYPYCGVASRTASAGWTTRLPARFLLVEDDFVANEEQCLKAIETLRGQGVDVSYEMVSGVTHGFDEEQLPASRLTYDETQAQRALDVFSAFLSERLTDG